MFSVRFLILALVCASGYASDTIMDPVSSAPAQTDTITDPGPFVAPVASPSPAPITEPTGTPVALASAAPVAPPSATPVAPTSAAPVAQVTTAPVRSAAGTVAPVAPSAPFAAANSILPSDIPSSFPSSFPSATPSVESSNSFSAASITRSSGAGILALVLAGVCLL